VIDFNRKFFKFCSCVLFELAAVVPLILGGRSIANTHQPEKAETTPHKLPQNAWFYKGFHLPTGRNAKEKEDSTE